MPIKILLLENIHPCAEQALTAEGFSVTQEKSALSEDQLLKKLPGYHVLGVRSKTQVSARVLEANPQLLLVGAFCIGTDQVALKDANKKGIAVFNAPYSNTRSVAELVLAEMIMLSRQLGDANMAAHKGEWLKSAKGSHEVRGKTLGIVGYGHIGTQVSVLAEGLGLRVVYYDIIKKLPLGNAKPMDSLNHLLAESDFVSLHVPDTLSTRAMIGEATLKKMRKGAFLINASRGSVVDIPALSMALKSGHVAGAAVDVFPEEPQSNDDQFSSELQGLRNVVLTPHIGGSTEEAQEAIGLEVSHSFSLFLKTGSTAGAVNFPALSVPVKDTGSRLVNVHQNVPGVMSAINGIVSEAGANIRAQYLSTDSNIGYLVMDIETTQAEAVFAQVERLPTSIKTRLI